ncbi:MAG: hypothetical protein HKN37_04510 [Rhodothermales bacterium]|nr:hypothetical protein [Rhodothermales bacterium]
MARLTTLLLILAFIPVLNRHVKAQTSSDSTAIVAAALDYIEGYYDADAERMEKALHPDLAKRIVMTDPQQGRSHLRQMSALTLIQATSGKSPTPDSERQQDVTILDIYGNTASVKVVATDWVDYLHVAKWNGEWKIVNVLWELKARE